jgi:hypothetical protein
MFILKKSSNNLLILMQLLLPLQTGLKALHLYIKSLEY